jgi:hypothetical protein
VLNAAKWLADSYGSACDSLRRELSIAEAQQRDFQARIGRPFGHAEYLSQLTDLRDQLKAGLSSDVQPEGAVSVAELAERIKALRTAHTVEAGPERTAMGHASAEVPVTARILRHREVRELKPTVEVEMQSVGGEAAAHIADRIKRAAGRTR